MTDPIKPTAADEAAAKSIEWVSTLIDDHEAIANAFALHAQQAREQALEEAATWLDDQAAHYLEAAKNCRSGNAGQSLRRFAQRRRDDARSIRALKEQPPC